MKRLLRISLDTLLMSTLPIVMWVLLGIVVNKDITNVFTLTYPIQFITTLLVSIFGSGANINATKSDRNNLVDSNIILGGFIGFLVTLLLSFNVNKYIEFMSMDIDIYKTFCIYSFILMYLQMILQLVCQKLYYLDETKKSNRLTIFFNIVNIILIILLSVITKKQELSVTITILIDSIIILFILVNNVKKFKFEFDIINNMKYVSNDILDRLGMFIIYFIGFRNTFEYGAIYLAAINFETLITDAQWDMSYAVITAATIDSSKDELKYKESRKNAHILVLLLIISTLIMGAALNFYYQPELWLVAIFVGIQIFDMILIPTVWIKQQYCQVNFSPKITTFNQGIEKIIRIVSSFLPTPFCTYIGQLVSMMYQIVMFNIVYRNKFYIENGFLKMKEQKKFK
ncbi:MAG: hypothetical protein IJE05_03140 [Clostridia bacterium]|nr:hypothetical protein [Clostridia bacterium]